MHVWRQTARQTARQAARQAARQSAAMLRPPAPRARPILLRRPYGPYAACRCRAFSTTPGDPPGTAPEERTWSTPLAKQLAAAISTTGPIPVASYMRMCLTSDLGGYYTGALDGTGRDPFGLAGDFVTSPEVSQVFGELVGIWFVAEWMSQGRPDRGVDLLEVGPGRGTLMDDILRTVRHFGLAQSIDTVYMVEASPQLRQAQKTRLCGDAAELTSSAMGFHSVTKQGQPIVWAETIQSIPQHPDHMPLIVAHEFFDALPIHIFESVHVPAPVPSTPASSSSSSTSPSSPPRHNPYQWREMVVSPTPPGATHASLHTPRSQHDGPVPDFQLTLAAGATRHARYLPDLSPRYQALQAHPGAVIEICPDAALYATDFAVRIGGSVAQPRARPAGAALILDYGPGDGTIPVNSLRGIRRHRRVSPFAEPGLTDLSVDVDFAAVAEAATRASDGVEVHGPVEQADFLLRMGIRERAGSLAKRSGSDEAEAAIGRSWRRLVDRGPNGMGKVYKALAILPENNGRRRPVGFGGDVVE